MSDDEALELLQQKNSRIERDESGRYSLIVDHGSIPSEQFETLLATKKLDSACNGAAVWWLRRD
jgi:hypothetical protein